MKEKDPNEEEFNQEDQDNINEADDSFGLPDLEFSTLDEENEDDQPEETADVEAAAEVVDPDESDEIEEEEEDESTDSGDHISEKRTYVPPKPESNAPKLIIALLAIVVVSVGVWYFMFYRPQVIAEEKARTEEADRQAKIAQEQAAKAKAEEQRIAAERAAQLAAETEKVKAAGEFTILTTRTGRYHVVLASFIDADMAADFGKKLAKKGTQTNLISSKGERGFHRVTTGDFGSFMEAQEAANRMKAELGNDLWVVKY